MRFKLLGEVVGDELAQRLNGTLLVLAVGGDGDGHALDYPQRQDAQKALGVDAPLLLLYPDLALELVGFLGEKRRGPRAESDLIFDLYCFSKHVCPSLLKCV